MDATALQPSIQVLQNDVVDLLEQVSTLMQRASQALSSDESSKAYAKKYIEFQRGADEALQNVKNLELVMSIVAPMKAGKSTIINAVIGQDLLPSRNAAMTTLPTEIVFTNVKSPLLTLSPNIISVFHATIMSLQTAIRTHGIDWARERVAQQPSAEELRRLLDQIATNSCTHLIQPKTSGCESIKRVLIGLNDIVRLCSVIDPSLDPQGQLTDIPRIETLSWRSQHTNRQSDKIGNLVIVDTPGPNESGEHLRLSAVVSEQLERSSIVLIVLDFNQLNNQAAAEIKKQVAPIIGLLGKENLYAIVNKVDQRRKGDMSPEQVQQFVDADLQLSDSKDANRVFEMSARQAFCAAKFILERQQYPDAEVAALETAEALAREALGTRWEQRLQRTGIEDLQKEADYLWEESGFELFLEKAVNALMESAAPRTMRSALKRSQEILAEFRDDVQLRVSSLLSQDTEKLQRQVNALQADLNHLELCQKRLPKVDNVKKKLQQNLKGILEDLKYEARLSITKNFAEEDYKRSQSTEIYSSETFQDFWGWLPKRIRPKLEYKQAGVMSFTSEAEAEKFTAQASDYAKQRAESLLLTVRKNTEREIVKTYTDLRAFLETETAPIIERARNRLNEAFSVKLSSPAPLDIVSEDIGSPKFQIERQTKEVTDYRTEKYRPFYFLFLIEMERKVPVSRTEAYYTVLLEDLVSQSNQSIEKNIDSINQKITKYLDEDFQRQIDVYFMHLDRYLNGYRESLKQAQIDQSLPINEKNKLLGELESLVPKATTQIQKADTYLERTNEFMPTND